MNGTPLRIPVSVLLAVLALASILLAPVAALSQHDQSGTTAVSAPADSCCAGACHGEARQQDGQQGDCCDTTACCCSCHAPLSIAAVALPLPLTLSSTFVAFDPQDPPQVYLPIFVPPQNHS